MPLFGSKEKIHCRVLLLDDSDLSHDITSKTKGHELLEKVFSFLNLLERDYFGLRYRDRDDQTHWLDAEKSIKKQVQSGPPFTLYFGVKFYAADPTKLTEELTRYQFFLQLKKDMLQGRLPCNFNVASELCGYAVQSELGDYDSSMHTEGYISEFRFLPSQTEELETRIAEVHQKLRGQVPSVAESNFLERVKWQEMYGVDLYPVKGQDNIDYFLGLTPTGIVLFKNKNKIGSFIWPKITKLKFKGDSFIVRANQGKNDDEKEFTFVLGSKQAAKTLWRCCAEHHTFFRLEKAKDVPSSAYNFLFRKSSGFRFSGRTQREIMEDNERLHRPAPTVRRVQSKRYTRRSSVEESKYGQARNGSAKSRKDQQFRMSEGADQGSYYAVQADQQPHAPWEQKPDSQSGLYTNGKRPNQSIDVPPSSKTAPSPRFPHPAENSTTVIGGDIEMPRRKVSTYQGGYVSNDEAKRKRSHYYSGYTSASDAESIFKPMRTKTGSEPNMLYRAGESRETPRRPEDPQEQMYYRRRSRESLHEQAWDHHSQQGHNRSDRRHRPSGYTSGSKSDGEQASRDRRRQHYERHRRRHNGGLSDSEMVPALDVRHAVGMDARRQHMHHRHHQHRHHQQQQQQQQQQMNHPMRQSRGFNYDPTSTKVLLELGPETGNKNQPVYHGDQLPSTTRDHYQPQHIQMTQQMPQQMPQQHVMYQHHAPMPLQGYYPPRSQHAAAVPRQANPHYNHRRFPPEQQHRVVEQQHVNRYMQQYLPPHLVRQDHHIEHGGHPFVEQVISPRYPPANNNNNHIDNKDRSHPTNSKMTSERRQNVTSPDVTSNYSISTEL